VGGIKEKILAARRAGINHIVLPKLNEKDVPEVPKYALEGMALHFVSHIDEVFSLMLDSKVEKRTIKTRVKRVKKLRPPSKQSQYKKVQERRS
jgi:ATP-dependent Lon protease